jgi:hypothetical protein
MSFTKDNINYDVIDGGSVSVAGSSLANLVIPSSVTSGTVTYAVTSINWRAFRRNVTITHVTFPATINFIGFEAFASCSNLSNVLFLGNKPATIEDSVFNEINNNIELTGYYYGTGWSADSFGSGITMIQFPGTSGGSGTSGGGNAPTPTPNPAPGSSPVACLPTGQRILTASGWRAVETLRQGDMIITDKGTSVPATIYSSTIKTTSETAPITIPANLFGRNAPGAPIRISPMHAVRMTKNVWEFPYNLLRSRDGVTQDAPGASVTYYHVAFPHFLRDNMVLEGGVVAESYGAPYAKANGIQGMKLYTYNERLGGYTRIGEGSIRKTA